MDYEIRVLPDGTKYIPVRRYMKIHPLSDAFVPLDEPEEVRIYIP